jgi:hypothetical protein
MVRSMPLTDDDAEDESDNPLDVIRRMATDNDWPFESIGDQEIAILVTGSWTNYRLSFTWVDDIEVLHLACAFEMKVPKQRLTEVQQLVASVNEELWIGHFGVWTEDGMVMYRHALLLAGSLSVLRKQCEALLGSALDACERYFPAFQYVVWAGKSAREAMEAVDFHTSGKA